VTSERPRFPAALSIAAAAVFLILVGLGTWQLQRAAWKKTELAKLAALDRAPPQPIGPVLARAAAGADVELARVVARCAPAEPAQPRLRMTVDRGDWIARALSPCPVAGAPYVGVLADRGILPATRGSTAPARPIIAPPGILTGVLVRTTPANGPTPPGYAPYVLSVESEAPPAPGVAPAPVDFAAADRLQYVGAYAPTWFGLAGVLACVYAALLWRRLHPQP
jgi:surfeit locus 1 family protein